MNIFDSYSTRLRNAIKEDHLRKSLSQDLRTFSATTLPRIKGAAKAIGAIPIRRDLNPESSLLTLQQIVQGHDPADALVGQHPDFRYLIGTEDTEMHYITSVFIDIKGSTRMHDRYELDTMFAITNTIQSAAIHVCLVFGGHIQRLQGDGVFVYFGGKFTTKEDSVKQAVTATAMFTYFVKNDLQKIFEEDGVENISTRIGIDFGDDHEVLWGNFGVGGCIELTTVSLHTSLASKCQGYANTNGIVVGQHVKDRLNIQEQYFDYVRDSKGEIKKRYIYEGPNKGVYYTQYQFNWFSYLKSLPYIESDSNDNLYVISDEERQRRERLRRTTGMIQNGTAFTTAAGNITAQPTGVKNQEHRFHYEQPIHKK